MPPKTAAPSWGGELIILTISKPYVISEYRLEKYYVLIYISLCVELTYYGKGPKMKQTILIAKALSDENRIKALMLLCGRELCVCQIVDFLKLAPSTVSKHMSILKIAGMVDSRKDERWIYYRLASKDASPVVLDILAWLTSHLGNQNRKNKCCGIRIPKTVLEKVCLKTKK